MATEFDASTLAYDNSLVRPGRLVDVLSMDVGEDIPATLLDSPEHTLGTAPVDSKRYYTQEFFDLENTRMWPRVWQYACWSFDIPNPGDTAVYRNAGESALVIRQEDGSIKAFVNSCLHRGRELCTDDLQHKDELKCPFHGFTWSLDGSLKVVPCRWDFPQVKEETHRLPEVRCEQWNGFVFVNFDPNAQSLESYLGKMVDQFASVPEWDYTKRFMAVNVLKHMRVNWKVCMEAFIEAFHVTESHSHTCIMSGDTITQYDVWPGEPHFSRMHTPMGVPTSNYRPRPSEAAVLACYLANYSPAVAAREDAKLLPGETARQAMTRLAKVMQAEQCGIDVSHLSTAHVLDTVEYFVFPHFFIWPTLGAPLAYRFRPGRNPEECIWETMLFLPFEGERPPSGPTIEVGFDESLADVPGLGSLGYILQQDVDNIESIQRGLRAAKTKKVTLSEYQEVRIRHMHQTLDHYISLGE